MERRSSRVVAAALALATLATLAWFAYLMLPQESPVPGYTRFMLGFVGLLALPYLAIPALLAWRDGRDGLRLAAATAAVNSLWSLPLATLLLLLSGFSLGHREQLQQVAAVVAGALLQLALLVHAGRTLRQARQQRPAPSRGAWLLAVLVPFAASATALLYFQQQTSGFNARADKAGRNDESARHAMARLQACLAEQPAGLPATLTGCAASTGLAATRGYRYTYRPAIAGADGRVAAYLLCAEPESWRATGYLVIVADSRGKRTEVVDDGARSALPPNCASAFATGEAIAWCAYAYAGDGSSRGYPRRLADIADCVGAARPGARTDGDRLYADSTIYAYIAAPPAADGRVARFRIYRLHGGGSGTPLLDEALAGDAAPADAPTAAAGLPTNPAHAASLHVRDCERGDRNACFVAGRLLASDPSGTALATARAASARACELGLALACTDAAGITPDAAAHFRYRACVLGSAGDCTPAPP